MFVGVGPSRVRDLFQQACWSEFTQVDGHGDFRWFFFLIYWSKHIWFRNISNMGLKKKALKIIKGRAIFIFGCPVLIDQSLASLRCLWFQNETVSANKNGINCPSIYELVGTNIQKHVSERSILYQYIFDMYIYIFIFYTYIQTSFYFNSQTRWYYYFIFYSSSCNWSLSVSSYHCLDKLLAMHSCRQPSTNLGGVTRRCIAATDCTGALPSPFHRLHRWDWCCWASTRERQFRWRWQRWTRKHLESAPGRNGCLA